MFDCVTETVSREIRRRRVGFAGHHALQRILSGILAYMHDDGFAGVYTGGDALLVGADGRDNAKRALLVAVADDADDNLLSAILAPSPAGIALA